MCYVTPKSVLCGVTITRYCTLGRVSTVVYNYYIRLALSQPLATQLKKKFKMFTATYG